MGKAEVLHEGTRSDSAGSISETSEDSARAVASSRSLRAEHRSRGGIVEYRASGQIGHKKKLLPKGRFRGVISPREAVYGELHRLDLYTKLYDIRPCEGSPVDSPGPTGGT
jgi:hypothetical protein